MYDINSLGDSMKPEILLRNLIRFNTTNPPGNESECIHYIKKLLADAGIDTVLLHGEKSERPNLIARLPGQGVKPPLLMYGHVDVVTAEHQAWIHPPFEGVLEDGCIWGRGALDMKGALTMMICAVINAKLKGFVPQGDILLCIVSDEEDAGEYGAKYLVENHPCFFKDVKYAIGEIGGFTMHLSGKRFYPVMIAEKQRCGIRATIKGQSGHGSMPVKNGAMARLSSLLDILNRKRLPVHITPPVKTMMQALSSNLPFPAGATLRALLNPMITDSVLNLLGRKGVLFDPVLHNTVNATIVRGGEKINVIPSEITLDFDGRILPGLKLEDLLSELEALAGKDIEFEVKFYDRGPLSFDMGIFDTLSQILKEEDNGGIPIPFVVSGVTDARFFAGLGIQTYGFTPMYLKDGIDFPKLIHNSNERIPVEALYFGVEAIYKLMERY